MQAILEVGEVALQGRPRYPEFFLEFEARDKGSAGENLVDLV
jgi:hypothetical protein